MKTIRCMVACYNANGEPDLYFCKVNATPEQIADGMHYDAARREADSEGYEVYGGSAVFDENDTAGRRLLNLFEWDMATLVEA